MQHIEENGGLLWLGAFNFLINLGLANAILFSLFFSPPQCSSAKLNVFSLSSGYIPFLFYLRNVVVMEGMTAVLLFLRPVV